jgi:hypothetical protein
MQTLAPTEERTATRQKCFICGKEVADHWFCRLPHDGKSIVFCCPSCSLRYFDTLSPLDWHNGNHKMR